MAFAITSTTGAGTVSIAANSRNVTGSGAAFTSALIGRIFFVGSQWGIVASVTDTATLTLDRPFTNAVSGAAWGHAATSATITQSGTDSSLAGLAAVPGVTTTTFGSAVTNAVNPRKLYDLGGLTLTITGSLSQDANFEELYFGSSTVGGCVLVSSGGAYLPTTARNLGIAGLTAVRTYQTAISANRAAVGTFNLPNNYVVSASSGSTFSPTGVTIKASLNVLLNGNGTCTDSYIIGGGNATPLVTLNSNSYVINSLYIVGTQGLVFTSNNQASVSGLSVRSSNGTSQHDSTGWTTAAGCPRPTVLNDYTSIGSTDANFRDFGYWWNGGYKIVNSGTGSRIVCRSNTSASDPVNKPYGNGFTIVTRNVSFTLSAPGVPVTTGVIFMRDYNNGLRRSLAAAGFTNATLTASVPDYSADQTYLWQANASGVAASQNVTVAVNTCDLVTLADPRTGNWDYRSKNGNSTDVFDFTAWSYPHLVGLISNTSLVGTGTLNVAWTLFNDTDVTLSESAVAALTSISTFDDLYDAAKYWKTRPVAAQLEYPTISTQPVTGNGSILDLGSRNLVVDASAAAAFAIDTAANTITIKASVLTAGAKFKSLTTTGTVTLANGAEINAPYSGSAGTNTVLTVTSNQAGARLRLTDNTGTERFNDVISGTSQTLYFPPGSTGTWNGAVELYGYGRQTFSVNVTGGGVFSSGVILIPDSTISADFATVSAYTALDTSQELRDWIAYYNQTSIGIGSPITAVLTASSLNIGSATLAKGGTLGFAGGVLTTGATTLSGVSIVTTGTQNAANLPTLTYPQQFTDSVGSTNWLKVTLTSGQVAQDSFDSTFRTSSYTTFLPATYTSATTLTVTARGYKKQQVLIPYTATLLAEQSFILIPDAAVVDTSTDFLTTATALTSEQQMYDAYSQWQATAEGVLDTYLPNKSPGALDFGSVAATFAPAATATVARGSGTITFKVGSITSGTYYSTGNITITGVTLADTVQIRASNLDSEIHFVNIDESVLFPSQSDLMNNTNQGPTLTGTIYRYKYGSVVDGVTLSGNVAARLTTAGVIFLVVYAVNPGSTTWSLEGSALISAVSAKVDAVPAGVWAYADRSLTGAADANVTKVNGVTVSGVGSPENPWGPAA